MNNNEIISDFMEEFLFAHSLWMEARSGHTFTSTAASLATQCKWGSCVSGVLCASKVPSHCTETLVTGRMSLTKARYESNVIIASVMVKYIS